MILIVIYMVATISAVKEAEEPVYPKWLSWVFLLLLFTSTLLYSVLNGCIINGDNIELRIRLTIAQENKNKNQEKKIKAMLKLKTNFYSQVWFLF